MRDEPVISVVVPLFNKRKSIRRTLESILTQTVDNIEVLVVDDGSTDGSSDEVEAVRDPRLQLMRQANTGPNQARNNAVRVARADLIAFVDADDEWTPAHLANILETRRRFPDCGIYATNFRWVMPDGSSKLPEFPEISTERGFCVVDNYFAVSTKTSITTCSSVALPRVILDKAGGFPSTEFVKQAQPLWVKISLDYEIGFCTEPSLIYRLDAENRWDAHIRKIKSSLKDCDTVLLATVEDALSRRAYTNRAVKVSDIRAYRRQVLLWRASDLIRIGHANRGRCAALKAMAQPGYFIRSLKLIAKSFLPE